MKPTGDDFNRLIMWQKASLESIYAGHTITRLGWLLMVTCLVVVIYTSRTRLMNWGHWWFLLQQIEHIHYLIQLGCSILFYHALRSQDLWGPGSWPPLCSSFIRINLIATADMSTNSAPLCAVEDPMKVDIRATMLMFLFVEFIHLHSNIRTDRISNWA